MRSWSFLLETDDSRPGRIGSGAIMVSAAFSPPSDCYGLARSIEFVVERQVRVIPYASCVSNPVLISPNTATGADRGRRGRDLDCALAPDPPARPAYPVRLRPAPALRDLAGGAVCRQPGQGPRHFSLPLSRTRRPHRPGTAHAPPEGRPSGPIAPLRLIGNGLDAACSNMPYCFDFTDMFLFLRDRSEATEALVPTTSATV